MAKAAFEPSAEDKYSQLAPLAVVALLLGAASLLALIGPLFFLIPVAAIGVALVALGKIGRSDGALSGSGMARAGLALGTIFLVAAFVRSEVRDRMFRDQAADFAVRWIRLMTDGDVAAARTLLTGDVARSLVPRPEPGTEPLPNEELERMVRERLERDPLVRDFVDVERPQVEIENVSDPVFEGVRTIVAAKLFLADPASGEHRHVDLQLSRNKYYESEGEPWRIDRWESSLPHGAH
jgi:hypothetical protein